MISEEQVKALNKVKELTDTGVFTKEEFEKKRAEFLNTEVKTDEADTQDNSLWTVYGFFIPLLGLILCLL